MWTIVTIASLVLLFLVVVIGLHGNEDKVNKLEKDVNKMYCHLQDYHENNKLLRDELEEKQEECDRLNRILSELHDYYEHLYDEDKMSKEAYDAWDIIRHRLCAARYPYLYHTDSNDQQDE